MLTTIEINLDGYWKTLFLDGVIQAGAAPSWVTVSTDAPNEGMVDI